MTRLFLVFALPVLLSAASPTADEIMHRVAANQTRAQEARNKFVYDMNVFVRLKRGNGKLAREESRDYVVAPTAKRATRKLVKVEGKILDGKKQITYTEPGFRTKNADIDGAITDSFAREVMWRRGNLGPMVDWFPLTDHRQRGYTFKLTGEERYHDHDVYKVNFDSHNKEEDDNEDNCWSGEALIDKAEFQPVLVTTHWTCKIPTAVKVMLGINVQNIGAKITYQRFDRDVWFPVNCGGELKLRVLFGYARTIAFSAKNSGFRKADVQTSIDFDALDDKSPNTTSTEDSTT
jgi:hypothetical protein